MFEAYKQAHEGFGPLQVALGKQNAFDLRRERVATDELVARVSADDSLSGMSVMVDASKNPMTVEQHQQFRQALGMAASGEYAANATHSVYQQTSAELRARAVGPDDIAQLDVLDAQATLALSQAKSANPDVKKEGMALADKVLAAQQAFSVTNEQQRLQLEASQLADRESRRKEVQSFIDGRFAGPMIEDRTRYSALSAQLKDRPDGLEAPASVVTAVLEYSGAQLRQSDDGSWAFSVGPVSYSPQQLHATYGELRNTLSDTYGGRQQALQSGAQAYLMGAQKQGFGLNGSRVSDLLFPLADAVYAQREKMVAPAPPAVTHEPSELDANPASTEADPPAYMAGESLRRGVGSALGAAAQFGLGALGISPARIRAYQKELRAESALRPRQTDEYPKRGVIQR